MMRALHHPRGSWKERRAMSKILVVDDSRLILNAIEQSLLPQGHDLVLTENPLEVPHLIRERRPDLVLIDLNMPTMRGDVVARIVRKAFGNGVVVLLHTEVPEEARTLMASTGADGVVPKSQDESVLINAVSGFLKKVPEPPRAS
jgi:CheY-like chemotaxis protein